MGALARIIGSSGARASTTHVPAMTLSFKRPDHHFWANATSDELYSLDLQELFTHLFCANQRTTEAFLTWLPESYYATDELRTQAAGKLSMLQSPIFYCNQDCDNRQHVSSWAMNTVPAGLWVEYKNHLACQRLDAALDGQRIAVV
jgi:hypothetical protein